MECKNCKTHLIEESDYCHSCGGKVIRNRLTLRNLFEHFSETFFNYDNKVFQTFLALFKKPEEVIGTYIDGTRKKYVDVVSYFALAITLSGLQLFILNRSFPEQMDMSRWTTPGTENFNNGVMTFVTDYQSLVMMLYVPFYALIARVIFINKKIYNFTEQLVIFMYIQAQISIASALIITPLVVSGLDFGLLGVFLIPAMVIYSAYCLKRLYQLSIAELILKTLLFLIFFFILFIVITIIFMAIMYLNGDLEKMMEARKVVTNF